MRPKHVKGVWAANCNREAIETLEPLTQAHKIPGLIELCRSTAIHGRTTGPATGKRGVVGERQRAGEAQVTGPARPGAVANSSGVSLTWAIAELYRLMPEGRVRFAASVARPSPCWPGGLGAATVFPFEVSLPLYWPAQEKVGKECRGMLVVLVAEQAAQAASNGVGPHGRLQRASDVLGRQPRRERGRHCDDHRAHRLPAVQVQRELEGVLRPDQEAGHRGQHRPRDQALRRGRLPYAATRQGGPHARQQGPRRDRRRDEREDGRAPARRREAHRVALVARQHRDAHRAARNGHRPHRDVQRGVRPPPLRGAAPAPACRSVSPRPCTTRPWASASP